jgi:hypothetical protein
MYQAQSQGVPSPALSNATNIAALLTPHRDATIANSDTADRVFNVLEIFFTALFSCELVMNMVAFWIRPFLADPWSWFDMVRAVFVDPITPDSILFKF